MEATDYYLGIDPGLNKTGYAILVRNKKKLILKEGGIVRSTAELSLAERVCEIGTGVREVIEQYQPKMMAIEQVFSFGKNPKTAIMLAHVRGAILMVAAENKIPIVHYTPRQIKKLLTGSGSASKEQMQHAVKTELGLKDILKPNDVADASAIGICLCYSVRFAA
ncbi:Crossover junction endodeoxyribonuclease RuvC [hydrothermal vent metagenome]|uniref:Crossover junction endodeoxyribonuclease RuvC n=1 Tax=hydrothermal vent metagenome TaxID=652676 RepID=A0A3B1DS55_9ZZZZ